MSEFDEEWEICIVFKVPLFRILHLLITKRKGGPFSVWKCGKHYAN